MREDSQKINPGINAQAQLDGFTSEEMKIIDRISKEWYITSGGSNVWVSSTSCYKYLLIKPVDIFSQMFNIDREIVVVFSSYDTFEPRTLDAIDTVIKKHQALRIEKICGVVISKDSKIEEKIVELLKNDQEARIVIPFSYSEFNAPLDSFFFRNRFKKHFYSRDLFASEAPLKSDLYFFGRTDLIHSLVNRHRSNQVSGLFGLRKTGKTSVVFGTQRAIEKDDAVSAFIDCQNPSFHRCRWNKAIHYILNEIIKQNKYSIKLKSSDEFTEECASVMFEDVIQKLYKEKKKSILIIFDEIENITPSVSPSDHWTKDNDFIFLWQTLRSSFQKLNKVFSYLIVGTNPLCVEMERINGRDNPIFGQIPLEYIPRFDIPQTREMIRRLGKIMGLNFDEFVYGKLNEDFGGHPYLMRHVCSVINRLAPAERPVKVDKVIYEKARSLFLKEYNHYLDMILNVLKDYFHDEYEMLLLLSRGDYETFKEFSEISPLYTNHLSGYGIIEQSLEGYCFRVDAIREHLEAKNKYKKINQTHDEMIAEISERRNLMEPKLRQFCRNLLQVQYGEIQGKVKVLAAFDDKRRSRVQNLTYVDLFNANLSGILFSDLERIIDHNWECFKNIFGTDKHDIIHKLRFINKHRIDAHAKDITSEDMQYFRISAEKIEGVLKDFF